MISETDRWVASMLTGLLPAGWSVVSVEVPATVDGVVELRAPDGGTARLVVEASSKLWPRDVMGLKARLRRLAEAADFTGGLVVAPWLSPRTRATLAGEGVSYLDREGSVHLALDRPAVFLHLDGTARNPDPPPHALRSLRGRGAGRAVRALIDFALPRGPVGIRELAEVSGASAATLSRVAALLQRDDLVQRDEGGALLYVGVRGVLRRWAEDYPPPGTRVLAFLEPRGLGALPGKLAEVDARYAATGAWGMSRRALTAVAPAAAADLWVDDADRFARDLSLFPAERGGNVVLREAWDDIVFERPWPPWPSPGRAADRIVVAAAGQVAVDLLTGPGREPAQGEEMLASMPDRSDPRPPDEILGEWMRRFGERWQQPWPGGKRRA